jgi:uncharacterized coiled-coil protein SlyX
MSHDGFEDPHRDATGQHEGLAEAQIAAIEGAFAEQNRILTRLRRELDELRDRPQAASDRDPGETIEDRLATIEARLDQQDQALRHVLQRMITFLEREGPL